MLYNFLTEASVKLLKIFTFTISSLIPLCFYYQQSGPSVFYGGFYVFWLLVVKTYMHAKFWASSSKIERVMLNFVFLTFFDCGRIRTTCLQNFGCLSRKLGDLCLISFSVPLTHALRKCCNYLTFNLPKALKVTACCH